MNSTVLDIGQTYRRVLNRYKEHIPKATQGIDRITPCISLVITIIIPISKRALNHYTFARRASLWMDKRS